MIDLKSIKAIRVQIKLGIIPLNVYQLPDGRYCLAGRNVTDAVKENNATLPRYFGVKSLKDLPSAQSGTLALNHPGAHGNAKGTQGKRLSLNQIKADTGETFIPVAIEDAAQYWGGMAQKGNEIANAILVACTIESIERRADHALGIQLSEEYRNARMQARIDGILQRNFWTKCIQWYLDNHPGLSQNYKKFIYSNVSDYLNRQFFGLSAKDIRKLHGIPSSDLLRDHVEPEYLPDITFVEKYAGKLVQRGSEPLAAIKDAVSFAEIKPRPFKVLSAK